MQTNTILYVFFAILVAAAIVYFQYFFKSKQKGSLKMGLAALRFVAAFALLLLLINPKFTSKTYTVEKPNLVFLVDNSSSLAEHKQTIENVLKTFTSNTEVQERFQVSKYQFGADVAVLDSLNFKESKTNIQNALQTVKDVFARRNTAVVVLSDGNQNIGAEFTTPEANDVWAVNSVTVGDTTQYEDISVGAINTNTYAFLNNKFPLETYVAYQGKGSVETKVDIRVGGSTIYNEVVRLSEANSIKNINTFLNAKQVGLSTIEVRATALNTERNKANNKRETTIDIIDEKTSIVIVSEIQHPDLGAFKKAIESNEQRKVLFVNPAEDDVDVEGVDVFILYQPTSRFKKVFDLINNKKSNYILVTGSHTDYGFLNAIQSDFSIENGYPEQEVFGTLNAGFSKFDISEVGVSDFPPLSSKAGPITFNAANETLLGSAIKGAAMDTPLFSVFGENTRKNAVLLGEGFWKWRMQAYRNKGNFENIDGFIGMLLRYVATNATKDRLNITYNKNYEGSSAAVITATYFDEAYVFDTGATLEISVQNTETKKEVTMPMLLKNGYFEADLANLPPALYSFRITVKDATFSQTGSFTISDFDIEKQFVSSDYKKMQLLALNNNGTHAFSNDFKGVLTELTSANRYLPTQKSTENTVSLVDFEILLAIIALALTAEWFLRKYNGLI